MPTQRATDGDRLHGALRRAVQVAACRSASRPSRCASRAADGWCSASTNVSSSTSAAFLKPASTSPTSTRRSPCPSAAGRPRRRRRSRPSVHFSSCDLGRGGRRRPRCRGAGAVRGVGTSPRRCPRPRVRRRRAAGSSSGSTTNGSGSKSMSIFSIASAAVSSSTAATRENRLALIERLVRQRRARPVVLAAIACAEVGDRRRPAPADRRR